jgi:GTP pyrophosphokinase
LEAGKKFNLWKIDDVYAAVGDGSLTSQQIITKIKDKYLPKAELGLPKLKTSGGKGKSAGISIKGVGDVMVRLSLCCNPIPADDIVGYITRGRGVSIHRTDCPNVMHYRKDEPHRIIEDLTWDTEAQAPYRVAIEVEAIDRPRLATDIMNIIADTKININAINARGVSRNLALVDLKIEVNSMEQLTHIMEKIKRVKDVLEVRRVLPKRES